MTEDTQLIIDAVRDMGDVLGKRLDDHEARIRVNERAITQFKTISTVISGALSFIGWNVLKRHLS